MHRGWNRVGHNCPLQYKMSTTKYSCRQTYNHKVNNSPLLQQDHPELSERTRGLGCAILKYSSFLGRSEYEQAAPVMIVLRQWMLRVQGRRAGAEPSYLKATLPYLINVLQSQGSVALRWHANEFIFRGSHQKEIQLGILTFIYLMRG